jgi:hypothetical protein
MQNVGPWRRFGKCSIRCPYMMWHLGMPCLEDLPCMGMVKKLLNNNLDMLWTIIKNVIIPTIPPMCNSSDEYGGIFGILPMVVYQPFFFNLKIITSFFIGKK